MRRAALLRANVCWCTIRSNRPDLQLDFEALAATYLWVFTINATQLLASLYKFPISGAKLQAIRERWVLRRAVVRYAEIVSYERGEMFRGRLMPVYAKEIKEEMKRERAMREPIRTVRCSRIDACAVRYPPAHRMHSPHRLDGFRA